ncbi:MAG TPA: single-stranded DNA-binding protein [Solirubrobacterales bacterium]|nr:single-stranded DNA-binding protein [Solirubrobacterales bacterium]
MQGINVVVLSGNLTRDPQQRSTEGDNKVTNLRLAVNGRRKNGNGEWVDKPNYFNVSVWGKQGERCYEYLKKGRAIVVEGRLDWKEQGEGDDHREYVQVVANVVQFGGKPNGNGNGNGGDQQELSDEQKKEGDGQKRDGEDDIPF